MISWFHSIGIRFVAMVFSHKWQCIEQLSITRWIPGSNISLSEACVDIATHLSYSGFPVPSIISGMSLNWRRTSCTISIAAFLILITNPYALFDVGFQFSFLAVIGIVFFAKRILKIWSPKSRWWFEIWNLVVVSCS